MGLQISEDFHIQSLQSPLPFKAELHDLHLCTVTNISIFQLVPFNISLTSPPPPPFLTYLTMVGAISGPSDCLSSRGFRLTVAFRYDTSECVSVYMYVYLFLYIRNKSKILEI